MWFKFDENVVEDDLKKLKEYGIKYLRVFINWRDFQPIHPLLDNGRNIRDYRLHEADLPQNPYYLDETMLERFGIFCDIAEKYDMHIFTKYHYGKGTVYYLNFPIESNAVDACDAFDSKQYIIYDEIFRKTKSEYILTYDNKYIGMTRHIKGNSQYFVLINYSSEKQKVNAKIKEGCSLKVIKGDINEIKPFEMTILKSEQ